MVPSRNQHTIASSCTVRGRGYWTGKDVSVSIHPAKAGTGVTLVRTDLEDQPSCLARVDQRVDANLRTNVASGEARFDMIEHLMSALYALEIDNCLVEIDGGELPGLDGSAAPFVDALRESGLIIQAPQRQQYAVHESFRIGDSSGWIEVAPSRSGRACFEYQLSFDSAGAIPNQSYRVELTPRRFMREVAPARTFVTSQQAKEIRSSGHASHVTNQDLLVIGHDGPLENEYRFTNECARHKTLDLIGDLSLVGVDLIGSFVSFRGGHSLNGRLAEKIFDMICNQSVDSDSTRNRWAA